MALPDKPDSSAKPEAPSLRAGVAASPFVARSPSAIPRRQFLCGPAFQEGHITLTIAPAGVGKTSLNIAEAVHMAAGARLFEPLEVPLKVWLFNGEESQDELERRIAGTIAEAGLSMELVARNLFTNSGRDMPLILVQSGSNGMEIDELLITELVATIRKNKIKVMIVDPFIATHAAQENNNAAIDKVGKLWAKVAHDAGCSVHLVHHTRKSGGDELTADSVRGASSLVAAARYVRALSRINGKQAQALRFTGGGAYVRIDVVKENNSSTTQKQYFAIRPHKLGNGTDGSGGDEIGVVVRAEVRAQEEIVLTDALVALMRELAAQGNRRVSTQSPAWIGHDILKAFGWTDDRRSDIPQIIERMKEANVLAITERSSAKGKKQAFYVLPEPACQAGGKSARAA